MLSPVFTCDVGTVKDLSSWEGWENPSIKHDESDNHQDGDDDNNDDGGDDDYDDDYDDDDDDGSSAGNSPFQMTLGPALTKPGLYCHPSCPPAGGIVDHGKVGPVWVEQPLDSRVGAYSFVTV